MELSERKRQREKNTEDIKRLVLRVCKSLIFWNAVRWNFFGIESWNCRRNIILAVARWPGPSLSNFLRLSRKYYCRAPEQKNIFPAEAQKTRIKPQPMVFAPATPHTPRMTLLAKAQKNIFNSFYITRCALSVPVVNRGRLPDAAKASPSLPA